MIHVHWWCCRACETHAGRLQGEELLQYLKQESEDLVHSSQFARDILQTLLKVHSSESGPAEVTREEFIKALMSDQVLYDCFAKTLISENVAQNPLIKTLFSTSVHQRSFDIALLSRIWDKSRKGREGNPEITREQFRVFMSDNFGTQLASVGSQVDKLFDELDKENR